jgi:hypothetical protein
VHLGDPSTLGKLFRSELWRGRDNLRVSLRYGLTLRGLPSVVMPVLELICLAVAPLALAAALVLAQSQPPPMPSPQPPSSALGGGLTSALALAIVGLAALAVPLALTALRVLRMARWGGLRGPLDLARAFIVAGTYDLARALALLARARHHQPPAQTPSQAATS